MSARVAVAMSGGVDSSVAAALLVASGVRAEGLTLLLGDDPAPVDAARTVCERLGIGHHVIDARGVFESEVVERFCAETAAGATPNPCVWCNERVKFGLLFDAAAERGADALATGHYARIARAGDGFALARAADRAKDQSYFLYRVPRPRLARVSFPLSDLTKAVVRTHAERLGIPAVERAESTDACFLHGSRAGEFVARRRPGSAVPGPVVDERAAVLGSHAGVIHYTVGQRRGLPGGGGGARYVCGIDAERATVIVGDRAACLHTRVAAEDAVWYAERTVRVEAQVRARMAPVPAEVSVHDGRLTATFAEPVCAAPGQAVVCYEGDIVIGGGTIREASG